MGYSDFRVDFSPENRYTFFMLILTHVYKIKPTRAQHAALDRILRDQRYLYNAALQERRDAWAKNKISIGLYDQYCALTEIRAFDSTYSDVPCNVSRWTLKRLDDAMKAFFKRVKKGGKAGFPRFRSASRWDSFGFHQKDGLRLVGTQLTFSSGITGGLRLRMHRQLPDGAMIKSAVFTKEGRHWRVGLSVSIADTETAHTNAKFACGVDVGVEALATLSDGTRYENVRPRTQRTRDLRLAARALSRCKKGSRRRLKVKARLAKLQRYVRDVRTTHLHAVSSRIVSQHGLVCVEALNLKNMTRSARGTLAEPGENVRQKAGLNRALADAAPGRLISMIRYKAERAGGGFVEVNPCGTSQECCLCKRLVPKALSERVHFCICGARIHRDHNAAVNVLERGLAAYGAARCPGELNVATYGERALGMTDIMASSLYSRTRIICVSTR